MNHFDKKHIADSVEHVCQTKKVVLVIKLFWVHAHTLNCFHLFIGAQNTNKLNLANAVFLKYNIVYNQQFPQ